MLAKLNELRQKRGSAVHAMREVLERCQKEGRARTADEEKQFEGWNKEVDTLDADIKRLEKEDADYRRIVALDDESRRFQPAAVAGPGPVPGKETATPSGKDEERAAFVKALRHGPHALNEQERRHLQVDINDQGGYLRPPMEFVSTLIKAVDDMVQIQQKATKHTLSGAASMGFPSLDTDMASFDWTAEIGAVTADTSLAFGRRELNPNQLTKLVKASLKALANIPNLEAFINERLAYRIGVTRENVFMTGSGAGQPLGLFTASNDGIGTARDVSTGNETTSVTGDGLINALYSLKPQYQARAEYLCHRDGLKQIRKLKDGNGQYLWAPGLAGGAPDTVLGKPVMQSEFAPSTFTTGQYVGLWGDFSFYWICEVPSAFQIQRLVELYAGNNQIGFIGRDWVDGAPVLGEAFARVKLA